MVEELGEVLREVLTLLEATLQVFGELRDVGDVIVIGRRDLLLLLV